VVDSGDGVTHCIPVAEGYVIGSCIKHIPIAGRDITYFIQQLLREREHSFANPDFTVPISELVDTVIQQCPIDVRRGLYENIVLSGGSTMFKDFARRMQRDIKRISNARLAMSEELSSGQLTPKPINVQVVSHKMQRYAVWFGGSVLADTPEFYEAAHTKAEYMEKGPSICRYNPVFGALT
ncbi:unnamed protein product, partial [Gongylonema pulchrum]|uniref:Actin-related protein 3 n=1 Tax=Gongylonema pulchrum TaxID=637853 RepID=A0A183EM90_9BILA